MYHNSGIWKRKQALNGEDFSEREDPILVWERLSQATTFNKRNAQIVHNCDEAAVTTVHIPPKILVLNEQKQVLAK